MRLLKLTVAEATDYWVWEPLQISVVVPDLQPPAAAEAAIRDDGELVHCTMCDYNTQHKAGGMWLKDFLEVIMCVATWIKTWIHVDMFIFLQNR